MGRLSELGGRPVRWLRDHPRQADALFAVACATLAVVIHLASDNDVEGSPPRTSPTVLTVIAVIVTASTIYLRRVAPVAAVLAATTTQMGLEIARIDGPGWIGVLVTIYSLAAHTGGPRRARTAGAIGGMITLLLILGLVDDEVGAPEAVSSMVLFVAAFVVGDNMRRRREHVQSLAERAERAERERDLLARERVTEERSRIARELHDIVAHSVSVMVLQAGAARRQLERDRDAALGLLHNIESTGRRTMDELRQVLGVLRDGDGASVAPLPALTDLEELVLAQTDIAVSLEQVGDCDHVPISTGLATYRIVQEALTNARRHGGPDVTVTVRLACTPDRVDVMVDDDGRGASATVPSTDGGGYGLVGMRERAEAAGGTLAAGPKTGGGWRVQARLPVVSRMSTPASRATASSPAERVVAP